MFRERRRSVCWVLNEKRDDKRENGGPALIACREIGRVKFLGKILKSNIFYLRRHRGDGEE